VCRMVFFENDRMLTAQIIRRQQQLYTCFFSGMGLRMTKKSFR
jgi:hypothetical protein